MNSSIEEKIDCIIDVSDEKTWFGDLDDDNDDGEKWFMMNKHAYKLNWFWSTKRLRSNFEIEKLNFSPTFCVTNFIQADYERNCSSNLK